MLSHLRISAAKSAAKPFNLSDGQGLFLTVQPNGSKLWKLSFRHLGKQKTLHLGPWPDVSLAEAIFDEHRRAVLDRLGFSAEEPTVTGGNGDDYGVTGVFLRLVALSDDDVARIIAVVIGETLAAGSAAVEAVGDEIGIAMADWWQADDALFSLLRDREVLGRMVAEVAGETIANANAGEKTKTLKRIVSDHLAGNEGRAKVERWVPRWMQFPPSAYTARGGVGTVSAAAKVAAARDQVTSAEADEYPEPFAEAA